MNAIERRAHNILHGQTLIDEWRKRNEMFSAAHSLRYPARMDRTAAAGDGWINAVKAEFGPACTMVWDATGCTLSNGERYEFN